MTKPWMRPLTGTLLAIGITTAMDATGLSNFSALPLCPLMFLFWYAEGFSRREIGFVTGRLSHHGLALLYPIVVMGLLGGIAALARVVNTASTNWGKAGVNLALVTISTMLVAILTEEGFFRGWLWASLRRAGRRDVGTLVLSSLAFSLWHVSAVSLNTGFELPPARIPLFLINAAVMGFMWGLLRLASGSILVASVSHGLWNGMAYVLFGYGTKVGALGITETATYGPEVGVLGLVVNLAAAATAWRWWILSRRRA